jgi:imidazolonepropionase-like amidohydrolase
MTCKGYLLAALIAYFHCMPFPVSAQDMALRGAQILTMTGKDIPSGVLVVRAGKIAAVGSVGQVTIPEGIHVEDVSGKVIMPGIVDTHAHFGIGSVLGGFDHNEASHPVEGQLRAIDAIWPADPGIKMALAGGITTANIMPGSGNVIGGQTAYVKLRGATIEEMLVTPIGGMKMANGENPKRSYGSRGQKPTTRMALAALQREAFIKAQEYLSEWQDYEKQKTQKPDAKVPKRDLQLEAMGEVLQGKRVVHFHSHRADDLVTAMRMAEEFQFKMVLQHATEAYLIPQEIARRNIQVSVIILDSPGGKPEAHNFSLEGAGILEKAGVKLAIHTDHPIVDARFLLRSAALAVRGGMTREGALKAVTLHAAEMLGLGQRLGSLELGKDADLVILSGDPLSVYTKVLKTIIDGKVVFDRSRTEDLRFATGGFWAPPAHFE